jgi:hypothetical protein
MVGQKTNKAQHIVVGKGGTKKNFYKIGKTFFLIYFFNKNSHYPFQIRKNFT